MWGYPYKTAIKGHNEAYILFIGVSRWLLPFPSGEGKGEGPLSFCPLCVLFICVLCEKKYVILYLSLCHSVFKKASVSLRHSVILSSKNNCLPLSLCHSVFKKTFVSICHYVILSSKKSFVSICHYVILSQKNHLSPSVPLLFCLKSFLCLRPSLCYSVSNDPPVFVCPSVTLSLIYSVCIVMKSLDNDVYKGLG